MCRGVNRADAWDGSRVPFRRARVARYSRRRRNQARAWPLALPWSSSGKNQLLIASGIRTGVYGGQASAAAARRTCSRAARFIGAHDRASLFSGQQAGKGAGRPQCRGRPARGAEQRDHVRERRGILDTNLIDCARNRPSPPQPAGR